MKKTAIILVILPLVFMCTNRLFAQQKAVSGAEWNFILGDWVGGGSGKPGEGIGRFSFNKDLHDNIDRKSVV